MTTLRRALSEDEYYFFSSYHENWLASRPLFAGLRSPERLRIVFGHYCHETLLSVFAHRPIYLFSGLRDPLARAVSGFRQANAVCVQAGRPLIAAADWLATQNNPICTEILRCFPSLAAGPEPLWQKARAALSLFDLLTATENFARDACAVLAVIDGPARSIVSDNVSEEKILSAAADAFVRDQIEVLRATAPARLGEDILLYEAFKPLLGKADLRANIAGESWALDRGVFVAGLPGPAAAKARFCAREQDFMLAEFEHLGRLGALRDWLQARADEAASLARRIVLPV